MFPQLVANETTSKGQLIWKFLKAFYSTPSLIQGNSEGTCTTENQLNLQIVYEFSLLYLPFQIRFAQPITVTIYELLPCILTGEYDT